MKDITALVRDLEEAGFKLARFSKHQIWYCPCGHGIVTVAATSGGGCGYINARLEMKRTLRVCRQRLKECA